MASGKTLSTKSKPSSSQPLTERYRPKLLADVVGQVDTVEVLKGFVANYKAGDATMPHLLFYGPAGTGKTTCAQAVARELYGDAWKQFTLDTNASDDRGIDHIRTRVKEFARTASMGEHFNIVILDECDNLCLPPGTQVIIGNKSHRQIRPIESISPDGVPMPSVNLETGEMQNDVGRLVDSGEADFFEMKLSDGRSVTASMAHPFFVMQDGKVVERRLRDLQPGDEIIDMEGKAVTRCETCKEWTTKKWFCSMSCKDSGHSLQMSGSGNPLFGKSWNRGLTKETDSRVALQGAVGEANGNWGKGWHGPTPWKGWDDATREKARQTLSQFRSGKTFTELFGPDREHEERMKRSVNKKGMKAGFSSNYRYFLKGKKTIPCGVCLKIVKVGGKDGIHVHHLDENHSNNNPTNLMPICAWCHNVYMHAVAERSIPQGWLMNMRKKVVQS